MKSSLSIDAINIDNIEIKGFKVEFIFTASELASMYESAPAMFAAMTALINTYKE